jgi:transcriptional regulator with XRE-family HTH domain
MVIKVDLCMDNYYPRLKDLREDCDLSQQQIADYLDMKQPQYSRYERGLRDLPTDVLIRLAKLYKTSTDYILGLTNNSKPYKK